MHGRSPSIYTRRPGSREVVDVSGLWLVNHLGRESSATGEAQRQPSTHSFTVDAASAEVQIESARRQQGDSPAALEGAAREAHIELTADDSSDGADGRLQPLSAYAERRAASCGPVSSGQAPAAESRGRRRLAADGRPQMRCRYGGMRCYGCGMPIAFGSAVCAGGDGLVHDDRACLERARHDLEVRAAAPSTQAAAAPTDPSSDLEVGKSLATYIDLEMEFALESGSDRMVDCLLPRDSVDVFIAFLRWAARRGVEGDAMSSLWCAGSTLMASTRGRDLTELAAVQQAFDELSAV